MTKNGYFRVCAASPRVKVADVDFNTQEIIRLMEKAEKDEVDLLVTPELSLTGYTCGDLFFQRLLLEKVKESLEVICHVSNGKSLTTIVGTPLEINGRRYNCAVVIAFGSICGIVPKSHIPNYGEFYEKRWFESGLGIKDTEADVRVYVDESILDKFQFDRNNGIEEYEFSGNRWHEKVRFGQNLLFDRNGVKIGIEICEDLWGPIPPSCHQAQAGAEILVNLSASDDLIGKYDYLLRLISQQSARCRAAYVYASSGWGESSTDLVFTGKTIIGEDGFVIDGDDRFSTEPKYLVKDIDVEKLRSDRAKYSTFFDGTSLENGYKVVNVPDDFYNFTPDMSPEKNVPCRINLDPHPFVPHDEGKLKEHCEEIVNIQARGLMQRLNAISCKTAVIGISGGLDSTLALLVTVMAFDMLGLDRKGIIGITMPGMATTSRTHSNAVGLMEELGVTSVEIPIGKSVAQHFSDIGQDPDRYDITYENSQARERTQILMDYSNKMNGIVIGTGDMSELALGWCTYNGDHMSMYGVNASVPKTLVKHLVSWFATEFGGPVSGILHDIVDTPISPELVPSGGDEIGQKTEDLVGPYELHDFYLYHLLRNSFTPSKIYWLACQAFEGVYDSETILKWLKNFYRRFFSQQFKRSCMPDGPKVGSVCLSPRGDWRMPSDASSRLWLEEVERIKN